MTEEPSTTRLPVALGGLPLTRHRWPRRAAVMLACLFLAACRAVPHAERGDSPLVDEPSAVETGAAPGTDDLSGTKGAADAAALDAQAASIGQIVEGLRGLSFDAFLPASHDALLARNPERVTLVGASERLGTRNDRLDDLSQEYTRETQDLERSILELLYDHDREDLSPDDRLSYDIYAWYLEDRVAAQRWSEHDYPITHCRVGHHYGLMSLLTDGHPMETAGDAEDYVARLAQVDEQVEQLLAGMRRRSDAGVVLPPYIAEKTQDVLTQFLGTDSRDPSDIDPSSLIVYTSFSRKLDAIDQLSEAERRALRDQALTAISSSLVPAYLDELAYLDGLAAAEDGDAGVWKLPDGDAYYAYRVRGQTTTDMTPDEVHELGLREVARVQAELREVFASLGYPTDLPLADLVSRAVADAGFLPMDTDADKEAVIRTWEGLVEESEALSDAAFDLRPRAALHVVGGLGGEFYVPASPDGTEPCEFHVGQAAPSQAKYMMRTVASHEGVPGHHYQIGLARELGLPVFRDELEFVPYIEGWAIYAERLAWELGYYADDPYGDVGRLLCELLRAARLVTDTGIHAKHWTREQAREYMEMAAGAAPGTFDEEVDRFIVAPAVALGNEVALLEIVDMRRRAAEALGDEFDIAAFHNAVIGHGSMPIAVLESVVGDAVATVAAAPPPGP